MSTKDGIIIILSSPSGAGKTTLVKKISSLNNSLYQFHIQPEHPEQMRFMEEIIFLLPKKNLKN